MTQPSSVRLSPAEARFCRLVRNGYFPAELPPPFSTRSLAGEAIELAELWDGAAIRKFWTAPEHYSIPRYGQIRRRLSLVNPINQLHVAHLISYNWDELHTRLQRSRITEFRPEIVLTGGGRAVTGVNFDGVHRRRAEILARFGRYIKTDIARFYPSVYTHSIGWAIYGKEWVKEHLSSTEFRESFANHLDKAVSAGQSGQTIGISIGPDTSRLLSELIATELEETARRQIPNLESRAVRYVDDILIGFAENESPDTILSGLSSALYEFKLELNGEKTSMHGLGFPHAPEWNHFIRSFVISEKSTRQRDDIDSYFEQAIHLSDANPRENVLLFAVKRAATFDVADENWNHLIQWFLYLTRRSTTCLSFIVEHLSTVKLDHKKLPAEQISEYIHQQIARQAEAAHTAEVSWLLFWAREMQITIDASALTQVLRLRSSICALLFFDMMQRNLIRGSTDVSFWKSSTDADGLKSEMWLAAYEVTKKGWWFEATDARYITSHPFFSELWNRNVEFYEPKRKSRPQVGRPFSRWLLAFQRARLRVVIPANQGLASLQRHLPEQRVA